MLNLKLMETTLALLLYIENHYTLLLLVSAVTSLENRSIGSSSGSDEDKIDSSQSLEWNMNQERANQAIALAPGAALPYQLS